MLLLGRPSYPTPAQPPVLGKAQLHTFFYSKDYLSNTPFKAFQSLG